MSIIKRLLDFLTPPASDPKPDELVFVAFANSEGLAELWASILRNAGVEATVFYGTPMNAVTLYGGTDWRVRVRYADVERAREILDLDDNGVPRTRENAENSE